MNLLLIYSGFSCTCWIFRLVLKFIDETRHPYWQRLYWSQVSRARLISEAVTVTVHDYPFVAVRKRIIR